MSYQAIADHLGISVKTVENHISRALKQLKIALAGFL
jgi:RNA polymerase sigma-19 factor, ECF subfamily